MNNTFNMIAIAMLISAVVMLVGAEETHTLTMTNLCKYGTPQFVSQRPADGSLVPPFVTSNGVDWTANAYLTGFASLSFPPTAEEPCVSMVCPQVYLDLNDNMGPSSVSVNIPTGYFYGGIEFHFTGGCASDSAPTGCYSQGCTASLTCPDKNVNLEITFCAEHN